MRKFMRYSYLIVVVLTCLAIGPFLLKDTFASAGDAPPLSVDTTQDKDNTLSNRPEPPENPPTSDSDDMSQDKTDQSTPQAPGTEPDIQLPSKGEGTEENQTGDDSAPEIEEPWAPPAVNCENRTDAVYDGANGAYSFEDVSADYFGDALFIGDSRTDGLQLYSGIDNATYFCTTGLNVFDVMQKEADVTGIGTTTLSALLTNYTYGKIYFMLGLNELGNSMESIVTQYYDVVRQIHDLQPDAILFVQGNLHVGIERSSSDQYFNNARINALNYEISKLADNKSVFYIDANAYFDDEHGNLPSSMTFDQVHLYGKHYLEWAAWLQTKGVVADA